MTTDIRNLIQQAEELERGIERDYDQHTFDHRKADALATVRDQIQEAKKRKANGWLKRLCGFMSGH